MVKEWWRRWLFGVEVLAKLMVKDEEHAGDNTKEVKSAIIVMGGT